MVKIMVGVVKQSPVKLYEGLSKKVPDYDEKVRKIREELFNGGEELFSVTLDDVINEVFINQKTGINSSFGKRNSFKENFVFKEGAYCSFVESYGNRKELYIFLENKDLVFGFRPEVRLMMINDKLVVLPSLHMPLFEVLNSKLEYNESFYRDGQPYDYRGNVGDFVLVLDGESSSKYVISFEDD